ncbi:MAG: hypothetical protein PVG99_05335 [Desulfobacteraceae bacterium]|jgi:hypothetical protein
MKNGTENDDRQARRRFYQSKGVTHFDKQTERGFFFILTLIMLGWGILVKLGVL